MKVLLASAAIPGMFPPVMFDVDIDGKPYQEMHVDGGARGQAFLYPTSFKLRQVSQNANLRRKRIAYIIRNGRPFKDEENVKRQTLSIAMQAVATMTASSGLNDTYRIYLTVIDDDFTVLCMNPFDQGNMQTLFDYGYRKGAAGYPWRKKPFGYL
jgi:hypothetical protein